MDTTYALNEALKCIKRDKQEIQSLFLDEKENGTYSEENFTRLYLIEEAIENFLHPAETNHAEHLVIVAQEQISHRRDHDN